MKVENWVTELPINMQYELVNSFAICRIAEMKRFTFDLKPGIIDICIMIKHHIKRDGSIKEPTLGVARRCILKFKQSIVTVGYPIWFISGIISAAEILAYYHPDQDVRDIWTNFCIQIANLYELNVPSKDDIYERYTKKTMDDDENTVVEEEEQDWNEKH